jgi:hypothetical protein
MSWSDVQPGLLIQKVEAGTYKFREEVEVDHR